MSTEKEKRYWVKEPDESAGFVPEFEESGPDLNGGDDRVNRRGFLKLAGFGLGTAVMSSCQRAPVEKAIPYLVKPVEVTPGRALYYASTCSGCTAACGILVKSRDGRPIKIEGNRKHPFSGGGVCATGQATILGLYDRLRLRQPLSAGKESSWEEVDQAIRQRLAALKAGSGRVRFLSRTVVSPTRKWMIDRFLASFPEGEHIEYDPLSHSAILDAFKTTHGRRLLPRYRFDRARVIVALEADFLGTWISPVEFTRQYRRVRDCQGAPEDYALHVQFEPTVTLSGSKADRRFAVPSAEMGLLLTHLAIRLSRRAGLPFAAGPATDSPVDPLFLDELEERLWEARGQSLLVCGTQDVQVQVLCNYLNHILLNEGRTVDLADPSLQYRGNDHDLQRLMEELDNGNVDALFVDAGINPVCELPSGAAFASALERVPLVISFSERSDETSEVAAFVCPDHHALESWGDARPQAGLVGLLQPLIQPIFHTRPLLESLSLWMGEPRSAYSLLQENWKKNIFPSSTSKASFQQFWDQAVYDGFARIQSQPPALDDFRLSAVQPIVRSPANPKDRFELVLYAKPSMLEGSHAHNAWLQELPDPISKVTWDNYLCLAPETAASLGVREGDVLRISSPAPDRSRLILELPAFIQPGQHAAVVAVALGYGRKASGRFAGIGPAWIDRVPSVGEDGLVGKNAAPFIDFSNGRLRPVREGVRVEPAGRRRELASTQVHERISVPERLAPPEGGIRPVIRETTLAALLAQQPPGPGEGSEEESRAGSTELWPEDHPHPDHHWGMAIDLNACTGCSACVVACQVENNIPVVGRDEVRRKREMHWLRIDRYYTGEGKNPDVAFQPMLCQQCDHAPCETVCPVLATVHSSEGLNQQIYNRCVGTRYCANNCPYKVRRFNWFNYPRRDPLENLTLNPDVTVRSRGVMEKCTFCVQRIQEARMEARQKGETISDGAIEPACQQTCPAGAIVFGDSNDPNSRLSKLLQNRRRFGVLEELNVRPSVSYLAIVRNREEQTEDKQNG